MSTIVTRAGKGSPLTNTELDANFTNLNADKLEKAGGALTGATSITVTDNTNAALRVTQLGTGNALLVEDSANPDSTPFLIDSNGRIVSGHTSTISLQASSYLGEFLAAGSNYPLAIGFTGASATGPKLTLAKNRSADWSTQTVVQSGDTAGEIDFMGSDGTNIIPAARIGAYIDAAPGSNDMPGRLVFSTTADGASSPTERMRIDSVGNVGIASASAAGYRLLLGGSSTAATASNAYGFANSVQAQSDVTATYRSFRSSVSTQAAAFTMTNLFHFDANQSTIGAGSAVTNQVGFYAQPSLTGATNNFGFYGAIAAGTGRYNFYAAGTADNYFAGNVLQGSTSALSFASPAGTLTPTLQVIAPGSSLTQGIATTTHVSSANGANIVLGKSRGASASAPTIVSSGDVSGNLIFNAYDGATYLPTAYIQSAVDGTPGVNDMPGRLAFFTTADGASAATERMRIDSAGNALIGTTTNTNSSKLVVAGTISETVGSTQYAVASQYDIGTAPNQIPLNQYLGSMAYQDSAFLNVGSLYATGNVGVGTSTPGAKLEVYSANALVKATASSGFAGFYSNAATGNAAYYFWAVNGTETARIGSSSTNEIFFANGSSATERMRIDSSGNVGIGTAVPATIGAGYTHVEINGTNSGVLSISAGGVRGLTLGSDSGLPSIQARVSGQPLTLWTNGGSGSVERARIDSSGNLLVGATSLAGGERLNVSKASGSNWVVYFANTNNVSADQCMRSALGSNCNNSSSYHLVCTTGGLDKLYVYGNGNVVNTNNSYGALSDIKLKENITDATPKLEGLMQVRVVNYNLIGDEQKQLGVVAQELEEVFPNMVDESPDYEAVTTTNEDGKETTENVATGTTTKSVKYSVFVPMLIKAIQEQQAIIESLTARMAVLEA